MPQGYLKTLDREPEQCQTKEHQQQLIIIGGQVGLWSDGDFPLSTEKRVHDVLDFYGSTAFML